MKKTTFKFFLMTEAGNFKRSEMGAEEFVDMLKRSATGWLDIVKQRKHIPIWRGDSNHRGTLSFGDSNNFTRSAANTANWYALWIDNSRKWSDFPKRTKSYICTNSYSTADGYGDVHVVIPLNNAHIGVVPSDDMWFGFKQQIAKFVGREHETVETFQDVVRECSRLIDRSIDSLDVGTMYSDLNHVSLDAMETAIDKVRKALDAIRPGLFDKIYGSDDYSAFNSAANEAPQEAADAVRAVWTGGRFNPLRDFWSVYQSTRPMISAMRKYKLATLANVFDMVFEPVGFKQFKGSNMSELPPPTGPDREIWIQGPCLFIYAQSNDSDKLDELAGLMDEEFGIDILQLMG